MRKSLFILCMLLAISIDAQQQQQRRNQAAAARTTDAANQPDVLVDIPNLSVEDVRLDVQSVHVQVALDARVANLLTVNAGADAGIERVRLQISGVGAEARLIVRLDKVEQIIDRTLQLIDNNPEILRSVLKAVDTTVSTVGDVANTALQPGGVLSQTVNTLGQTVQRTLDTTGNIVEKTLDTAGKVVNERTVGKLLDLPVLRETTNEAGQTVRQVRDTTGAVIEYTLDRAGKIVGSKVISSVSPRS
jgi:hypothetical protein